MKSSSSFVMQIANLYIEICGFDDEESACLEALKRVFRYHEVQGIKEVHNRIIVCKPGKYHPPPKATLQWTAPCLGVAGRVPRRRSFPARVFDCIFARHKERPLYAGTCNVHCYRDANRHADYFIPEYGEWRVEHHAEEHTTYVYSSEPHLQSDGLPSMLLNVIGSQYGCYLVFAACVATDEGALLLTGDSGVGKSTLCTKYVRQGAAYMGDDLVLLYLDGERAMAGSLLFPLKHYAAGEHLHKQQMDPASLSPQRLLTAPLKAVYLLQRGKGDVDSVPQPMRGGEMLEILLKRTNKANTNADAYRFVGTLSVICETVPCYQLLLGNHDEG